MTREARWRPLLILQPTTSCPSRWLKCWLLTTNNVRWLDTDSSMTWLSLRNRRRWWRSTATWERWAAITIFTMWSPKGDECSHRCGDPRCALEQAGSHTRPCSGQRRWPWKWGWQQSQWRCLSFQQVIFSDSVCRDCGEKVCVKTFFTGHRCPWGLVYGSRPL